MVTVAENFCDIDEDVLYDKSKDNNYFAEAYRFYKDVQHRDVDSLTEGQYDWLNKIEEDLLEE